MELLTYDEKELVETTDADFKKLGLANNDIHPAYKLVKDGKTYWFDFRGKYMKEFNEKYGDKF